MIPLNELTIKKFHDGIVNKQFSALEATQEYFRQIKERDHDIGAYLSLNEEAALRSAEAADLALVKGDDLLPLAGVPFAIKDNMCLEGGVTTAGSKILEHYTASYTATALQKIRDAGGVILGKTNLDEFAMGSSTENSGFHPTKNPHDTSRVPGGSSGGSAAAVAGGMALAALGSDTGGSIRQPAAFCGVVGLKPTYGAVSRSGLIAMASSLDQIGPLAKSVEDAALIFNTIYGKDPLDATNIGHAYDSEKLLNPKLEDMRRLVVGIPDEYFKGGLEPEVEKALEEARKKLESLGVSFKPISLPHTKYALSCYYIIIFAEVSSNLARFDGIRYSRSEKGEGEENTLKDIYLKTRGEGFGAEPKRRIILGTFVLSSGYYDAYYHKAQAVRSKIKEDFDRVFEDVDVIFAPTTPTTAFKIGEKTSDPLSMYLSDIFTIPVNLAGLPAISIPVSSPITYNLKPKTLPIGFQLIGKPFHEADILGLGQFYEKL